MNKKAIELSVNFLVVIIISITILAFAFMITGRFFQEAEELKESIDRDTELQITNLLSKGEKVALPVSKKTLQAGDHHFFGLGVLNVNNNEKQFSISLSGGGLASNPSATVLTGTITRSPVDIGAKESEIIPILVQVPAGTNKGTYIFTVSVQQGGSLYGSAKKLYVEII